MFSGACVRKIYWTDLTLRQAQSDKINEDFVGVLLETAHPAKFVEVVEDVLKEKIVIPEKLEAFNKKEKN